MKIVAGLGSLDQFESYVEAGAEELFCGCVPFDWLENYGAMMPINRREVLMYPAQIASMTDMRILARLSAEAGVPVAVTLNSTCLAPQCYNAVVRLIEELGDMGFSRLIVADIALLLQIQKAKIAPQIHLSGEFGEFSRAALEEMRDFPIRRLIFPRKVTPEEMKTASKAWPGLEYEAFVLNERCYYTGAMCNSLHCDQMPHLCRLAGRLAGVSEEQPEIQEQTREFQADRLGGSGCGLCALEALRAAGITHLKLVGRGNRPENMIRDIRSLKKALTLPNAEQRKAALYPRGCPGNCYYP